MRPKKLKILAILPKFLLMKSLKKTFGTEIGDLALSDYAMAARDEMLTIADEFRDLIQISNLQTPSFDKLYENFKLN